MIRNPRERIDAIAKLLPYLLARQAFVEVEDNTESWLERIDPTLLAEADLKKILSSMKTHDNENKD
jgi:hypothetical protein